MTLRLALLATLLPLLAACPPLPQPFAHSGRMGSEEQSLLSVPDSSGIRVEDVEGTSPETSEKLTEAMAQALKESNVPASTKTGNASSYFLTARVAASPIDAEQTKLLVLWELRDHTGALVGRELQNETVSRQAWERGDDSVVKQVTDGAAGKVASFIQDPTSGAPPTATAKPVVAIMPVSGAPGDGDRQLPRAVRYFLQQAGYEVTDDLNQASAIIMGTVDVAPPKSGAQAVSMNWSVMTTGGEEIGQVNLQNVVPQGSLDGAWGETAYAAAGGAVEGIAAILEKLGEPEPKF